MKVRETGVVFVCSSTGEQKCGETEYLVTDEKKKGGQGLLFRRERSVGSVI